MYTRGIGIYIGLLEQSLIGICSNPIKFDCGFSLIMNDFQISRYSMHTYNIYVLSNHDGK